MQSDWCRSGILIGVRVNGELLLMKPELLNLGRAGAELTRSAWLRRLLPTGDPAHQHLGGYDQLDYASVGILLAPSFYFNNATTHAWLLAVSSIHPLDVKVVLLHHTTEHVINTTIL